MIIRFTRNVPMEMSRFSRNSPISSLIDFRQGLNAEIENSYTLTQKGVKTDTPLLPQWDGKFYQLYCKNSGWFFAYKPIRGGICIYHAVHQTQMKDTKGGAQNVTMNPKQNISAMMKPIWYYVRDANYGFGIVKNNSGQFNYSDLNGDLLMKDKSGKPIWFDNVSPFSEGYLDRLSAYGIKDGYIVFFYSNGHYTLTKIPASKYGFTNTTVLNEKKLRKVKRKKNIIRINEEQLHTIIRNVVRNIIA